MSGEHTEHDGGAARPFGKKTGGLVVYFYFQAPAKRKEEAEDRLLTLGGGGEGTRHGGYCGVHTNVYIILPYQYAPDMLHRVCMTTEPQSCTCMRYIRKNKRSVLTAYTDYIWLIQSLA